MFLFPNIFWAMCLNGFILGVNVAIATTYASVITSPPYNWRESRVSLVNSGQIVVALITLPLLGYGSDKLIQWRAQRHNGMHEPENRLLPLFLPLSIGIFTAILYGQGASHPYQYHWSLYVWTVAGFFFAFIGTTISTITYLLDSYPGRAGPIFIILCTGRGIISFVVSSFVAPLIHSIGYDGTFTIFGLITGTLGLTAIPIIFYGHRIRASTGRLSKDIII